MTNTVPMWLPLGFQDWSPVAQAASLGLMTFVQEDVPTVGSAMLSAAGHLPWAVGLVGCFFGIWIGDALLYWFARAVGRPLLLRPWAQKLIKSESIARSERWFHQNSTWTLIISRFIPGMRLPTYLAAGFLRVPFSRFVLITGGVVALWTTGIFLLAGSVGPHLLEWLERWSAGGWTILLGIVVIVISLRLLGRCFDRRFWRHLRSGAERWLHWEFWPAWLFYGPVVIYYIWLGLRYRSFALPTAANPGMFTGGFVGESKIETMRDLMRTCPEFTAEAHLIEPGPLPNRLERVSEIVSSHNLGWPFIMKPDCGQRGIGVKLIQNPTQIEAYLRQTTAPLLVQRYVPAASEVGVFYYRFPHMPRGRIFAMTEKVFPFVTGNGQQTIQELIWRDQRARIVAEKYLKRLGPRRHEVPAAGEKVKLVEAGNHAQGCIFRDGARFWTEALERRLDGISQKLNGFFIGRYDLRFDSEADLRDGRNFQIIELNGASSEATNIYDARNSIFSAYRTLFKQWNLVFAIGAANRRRGTAVTPLLDLWRLWRSATARAATYPLAD